MSDEQPKLARKSPYAVQVEGGQSYMWCACGHSENQPFCDGSHKGTGFTPVKYTAEKPNGCGSVAAKGPGRRRRVTVPTRRWTRCWRSLWVKHSAGTP